MGNRIGIEGSEAEIGSLVHEAAIFSSQREVLTQKKVRTTAVNERAPRLAVGPRHQCVAGWVEHEGSTFSQHVWVQTETRRTRQAEDKSASCLVDVGLYS
jgi:hypothetical protein